MEEPRDPQFRELIDFLARVPSVQVRDRQPSRAVGPFDRLRPDPQTGLGPLVA